MKVQLYPEDILLEFVASLLPGGENVKIPHAPYLRHLPRQIDFSEEFAERWQALFKPVVKRLVADTFRLRPFLFDVDGYTKRFNCADEQFWNTCSFSFSQRGAERLYELMVREFIEEEPMFLVALPDDALILSICTQNFGRYSFPWLCRNHAGWLTKALFVAWQHVQVNKVPWLYLLENPTEVELPLRDYLIERCADLVAACNERMLSLYNVPGSNEQARSTVRSEHLPLEVSFYSLTIFELIETVRGFISKSQVAFNVWSGDGALGIDDERFIKGAVQQSGFAEEAREFERLVGDYLENKGMEETIYESIIQNQSSDRSSTE
ncbi:MAG: hypothetical protein KKB51_00790 [Candidatus Riflebacteria bacterium]|nr:hypothetical protein [Candidatus Riflebacteria bacterium]